MEADAATWVLLNWSRSAFRRRCGFKVVDVGGLRRVREGDFGVGSEDRFNDLASGHAS